MGITYKKTTVSAPQNSTAKQIKGVYDHFLAEGIKLMDTLGYHSVMTEAGLFETYKNMLSEGFEDANEKAIFEKMLMNEQEDYISEGVSIGNVDLLAPIRGMMLRQYLPKLVVKDTYPIEAVEQPHFEISYYEQYFEDVDGNRTNFKDYFKSFYTENKDPRNLPPVYAKLIPLTCFISGFDIIYGKNAAGAAPSDLPGDWADATTVAKSSLTNKVVVNKVSMDLGDGAAPGDVGTILEVTVNKKIDFRDNIALEVADEDGNTDFLFGKINRKNGMITLASANGALGVGNGVPVITQIAFTAYVNNKWNEIETGNIGFEITKDDYSVPEGEHINSNMNIEDVKDMKAMWNIDSTLRVIEMMTDFFARKVEYEGWKFAVDSWVNNNLSAAGYFGTFDVQPPSAFAGKPTEWRTELTRLINYVTSTIMNHTDWPGVTMVLVGNILDLELLTNPTWTFVGQNAERSGSNVSYNLGNFRGSTGMNYKLVSSSNIPQGEIRMMVYPTGDDDYKTYTFYTYSFDVVSDNSYRNPTHQNVPNIMMTKRYTFEEFTPVQGLFQIINNDLSNLSGYQPLQVDNIETP